MSRNWNKEQDRAIANRGSNTLISAGAGSGKTAVLTERVFQLMVLSLKVIQVLMNR